MIEITEQGYDPKEKGIVAHECLTKINREHKISLSWKRKVLLEKSIWTKGNFVYIREKSRISHLTGDFTNLLMNIWGKCRT